MQPQNRGFAETYGAEFNARYQVNKYWRLQGSYSFLKMALHVESGSADSIYKRQEGPQQQLTLQSFYQMTPQWSLDNSLYYVDNLPEVGNEGIDGYTRLDSRLEWQASQGLELSLTGMNLLDSRHQEFIASIYSPAVEVGRTILLGAAWEF